MTGRGKPGTFFTKQALQFLPPSFMSGPVKLYVHQKHRTCSCNRFPHFLQHHDHLTVSLSISPSNALASDDACPAPSQAALQSCKIHSNMYSCRKSMFAPAGLWKASWTEVHPEGRASGSTRPWWWGWSPWHSAACSGAATCCSSSAPTSSCCWHHIGAGRGPGNTCCNPRRPPCPCRGPSCPASHCQPGADTTCYLHLPQPTNSSCCLDKYAHVCTNSLFGPASSCHCYFALIFGSQQCCSVWQDSAR